MDLLQIGNLEVNLQRKAIKNLHISVMPPDGHIRVAAPQAMTETAIRMAVVKRIAWIKKQQVRFQNQPRQSKRQLVSGESHYLWGKRHRLNVVEHDDFQGVLVRRSRIILHVNAGADFEKRTLLLANYYRSVLRERAFELLTQWQQQIGVGEVMLGIRRMKTKWGSCNVGAKRIWLNLELAKKPVECMEFILVHELVHLLEPKHNDRFQGFMDRFLPDWRHRKDLLNSVPLAYEHWGY